MPRKLQTLKASDLPGLGSLWDDLIMRIPDLALQSDQLVRQIRDLIAALPPSELLFRAWVDRLVALQGIQTDLEMGSAEIDADRRTEYLQSVIAGTPPARTTQESVGDTDWGRLTSLIAELRATQHQYALATAMASTDRDTEGDGRGEELRWLMPMLGMDSRGKNYPVHWEQYYRDMLTPLDDLVRETWKLSSSELIRGLMDVHRMQSLALSAALMAAPRFRAGQTATDVQGTPKPKSSQGDDLQGLSAQEADLVARLFNFDLFDLASTTELPDALLDDLSWTPGEDQEFFGRSEMAGWPLLDWPTFTRPFIKVDDRHYCFDDSIIPDRIMPSLERAVRRKAPNRARHWMSRQASAAEASALQYIEKLLPGASVYPSVHYVLDGKSYETDGIVIFDGHLMVVEVKGGSHPSPSPILDFEDHVRFVRKRLEEPVAQASRVHLALDRCGSVELRNTDAMDTEPIAVIRETDVDEVSLVAVTLEPMTEFASQIEHLDGIGIGIDLPRAWVVSLDDLRLCNAIFDNPLIFMHYLHHRLRGGAYRQLMTNDELDHLGLYVEHNMYREYAEDAVEEVNASMFAPIGVRTVIDRHFAQYAPGDPVANGLRQEMPELFEAVIDALARSTTEGRMAVARHLLDSGGDLRATFDEQVRTELMRQEALHRPLPLSLYTDDGEGMTLFCWSPSSGPRSGTGAREHAEALVLMNAEARRLLLEVTFDAAHRVREVSWKWCELDALSESRREELAPLVDRVRRRRVAAAVQGRVLSGEPRRRRRSSRVGRNDKCPCGSGMKYKKCCLRRYGSNLSGVDVGATHGLWLGDQGER